MRITVVVKQEIEASGEQVDRYMEAEKGNCRTCTLWRLPPAFCVPMHDLLRYIPPFP
jgi:hypothetical protein